MKKKIKTWWSEEEINDLELSQLHSMFDCTTQEGVDVAYFYAKFLAMKQLTPDNYPLFLKLFATGNHWIVDALVGKNEPQDFLKRIQPNSFILKSIFSMLEKWKRGEIYPKLFLVILGVIKTAFENAVEGYRLYPISPEDVNNLGKQLKKDKGQSDPVNKALLHILDRFAEMKGNLPLNDENMELVATQSNKIRGKFLDEAKSLNEAIPPQLLDEGDYRKKEIAPSVFDNK